MLAIPANVAGPRNSRASMQYFAAPAGSTPTVTSLHFFNERYSLGALLDGTFKIKFLTFFEAPTDDARYVFFSSLIK